MPRRVLFGTIGFAVLAGALGLPAAVEVSPEGTGTQGPLDWSSPAACPDALTIQHRVEHFMARPWAGEQVRARGQIAATETGWTLTLDLETGGVRDTRVLSDVDCEVLAEGAALMIAMAIDPDSVARVQAEERAAEERQADVAEPAAAGTQVPEPAREPEPEAEAAPPVARDEPTRIEPKTQPRRSSTECLPGRTGLRSDPAVLRPRCGALAAAAGGQYGPLPGFGPGVGGRAAILWPRLRLELAAMHWFSRSARVAGDLGGDLRLTAATVSACGRLGVRRIELPMCGGMELGAMHGRGVNVDRPATDRVFWSAVVLGPRVGWSPVRRFAISGQADALIPLARYRFQVRGLGEDVYAVPPVGVRVVAGVELRFP